MKLRKLFIFFEVVLFYVLALVISYFINPEDPLFVNNLGINLYMFLLMIISLFYGLWYGIIGILILIAFLFYYYSEISYIFVMLHLLVVLIGGVFYYFFNRKVEQVEEEKYFLADRLDTLIKNFFLLKLSYEQLEKNYLLKPYSLRDVLKDIREMIVHEFNVAISRLTTLLIDMFKIEEGNLYVKEKNNYKQVSFIGYPDELDLSDPLVKLAIESKDIVFVSKLEDMYARRETKYIAVIPVLDNFEKIIAIMTIKRMPFIHFNKDNVLTIALILSYFFDDYHLSNVISDKMIHVCDFEFNKELYKLSQIKQRFKKDSCIVVFDIRDKEFQEELVEFITQRIRSTDITCVNDKILVILPLTSINGAESFVERIKKDINETLPEEYAFKIAYHIVPIRKKHEETIKDLEGLLL